jgi:hypothetical protein
LDSLVAGVSDPDVVVEVDSYPPRFLELARAGAFGAELDAWFAGFSELLKLDQYPRYACRINVSSLTDGIGTALVPQIRHALHHDTANGIALHRRI